MTSNNNRKIHKAVIPVIVIGIVGGTVFGLWDFLHDREQIQDFFQDSGAFGPIIYILAFIAAQPLSLPGAALIIPATFVWTWWEVFIYSMLGGIIASSIGFVVARWFAQDWIRKRLPQRFIGWEKRFVDHALLSTIALRLVTGYAPAADWFLGILKIRWREFLIGTIIGLIPTAFLFSYYGDDTVRWVQNAPLIALTVSIAFILLVSGFKRYKKRTEAV
ncbi:MAG: VTT domain-containing protein [Acidimicrobiales bacterium]|nr:VTT domain-containing protein [Acidimicrobiales bacterium]MDP6299212.1 VTT domain-containing protein [Acidimicrobiales bacterium]HJM28306.1 VTT domain-containing protein [Acidimicrobiales bacterium]HJM98592.1 VTT domain-containing protein [Acidimicrobiales bacterium]